MRNKKGFTLIEMLVVIAIIAVLISVVIPIVSHSTDKAEAAADAANLRAILGQLNAELAVGAKKIDEAVATIVPPVSKLNPGAELHVLYTNPGFIDVYYVIDNNYYGLSYLATMAEGLDVSTFPITKPTTAGTWYKAGSATPLT